METVLVGCVLHRVEITIVAVVREFAANFESFSVSSRVCQYTPLGKFDAVGGLNTDETSKLINIVNTLRLHQIYEMIKRELLHVPWSNWFDLIILGQS